jgi:hypothetical protein
MVKETKANSELWPTHNSELALKRCLTIYHCSCQKKGSGSGTNEQGMIRSCQSHVFGALLGMPQYPYSCGAGAGGSSTERALNHDHSFLTIETHLPKKQKKKTIDSDMMSGNSSKIYYLACLSSGEQPLVFRYNPGLSMSPAQLLQGVFRPWWTRLDICISQG